MERLIKHALIVDNAAVARKVMKSIFQNNKWNAVEVEDGIDAVKQYKLISPDIVIMEINLGLGNEDGITIAKKIIQMDPNANIIMVSSSTKRETIIQSTEAGAKGYLVKPINSERLINTAEKIIKNK